MVLWFILPFTDGAAIVYELITKPYVVPVVAPVAKACEGWLTTLALTLVNASHMVSSKHLELLVNLYLIK